MALLSMTGQGQGRRHFGSAEVTAEVRAVNNRHLKVYMRTSEGLGILEPKVESLVRSYLRRGSLQIGVQLTGGHIGSGYGLDEPVIEQYIRQCRNVSVKLGLEDAPISIVDLLTLPGVVTEPRSTTELDDELETAVLEAVADSLQCLNRMRRAEGESMALELTRQLTRLRQLSEAVERRSPQVVEEYRERLSRRLSNAMAELGASFQQADLAREILLMADKADIREEIVRLRSHFDQFQSLLTAEESQGRKLDFLIQEMFRETNTIGSKAGDAEIAQRVVDMKTVLEQMRELVQNVE
jgi:uncharacterized protein (TIGR00255 family)